MKLALALFFLGALSASTPPPPQTLATCVGADPCRACKTCKLCKYCNSGKGSCSVFRQMEDRKYEQRRK